MDSSQMYVNTVARQSGSNFYMSFFSLPRDQRDAMTAVYAFCREVDDAVDEPKNELPIEAVARWRNDVAQTYDGNPRTPLMQSLYSAIQRFSLSRIYFDGILDGVEMDLGVRRYESFDDLSQYCYHVAGEVGLLCMEIFGFRSDRLKTYAVQLGLAFQLTNILRDVGTDVLNGRVYLPQEDLRHFGVLESRLKEWAQPQINDGSSRRVPWEGSENWKAFTDLMAFQTARARDYYQKARALPLPEERPALRTAEMMRAIYENILQRIERRQYNVFRERVRVPTAQKLVLSLKTWWEYRS